MDNKQPELARVTHTTPEETAAKKAEHLIRSADSFESLFVILDEIGEIKGSDGKTVYAAKVLKELINSYLAGDLKLEAITSASGLRNKVDELTKNNTSTNANEEKTLLRDNNKEVSRMVMLSDLRDELPTNARDNVSFAAISSFLSKYDSKNLSVREININKLRSILKDLDLEQLSTEANNSLETPITNFNEEFNKLSNEEKNALEIYFKAKIESLLIFLIQ